MSATTIPNRAAFRAQDVCDIAQVQSYVLRTWEAEFPDLGLTRTAGGPRVYRRGDVERVLRIKHLLFVDGLTMAGARKQLALEAATPAATDGAEVDFGLVMDEDARRSLRDVRQGLQWILSVLGGTASSTSTASGTGVRAGAFALSAPGSGSVDVIPGKTTKVSKPRTAKRSATV